MVLSHSGHGNSSTAPTKGLGGTDSEEAVVGNFNESSQGRNSLYHTYGRRAWKKIIPEEWIC